ncbi:MAG: radical SAM protein [Halobacteriota archaeon]|nr:radical SAM protein [Halobacteriota archaeon]
MYNEGRKILLTSPVGWWQRSGWGTSIDVPAPIYGLDFLSENISTPHKLLQFPTWEEYANHLKSGRFTDLGISFLINHTDIVEEMIYLAREISDVRIVGGGHGAFNMKPVNDLFDGICTGWGIEWLREWLNEPVNSGPYRIPISDMEFGFGPVRTTVGSIVGTAGCTMGCDFCQITEEYERPRKLVTPSQAVAHMKENERRFYFFQDDNFFLHREWIEEFFSERRAQGLATPWLTWGGTELLKKYEIPHLVENGFTGVYIGYERSDLKKSSSAEEVTQELIDNDVLILGSFILGWEDQTKADVEAEIEWAKSLNCDLYYFACYVPLPNTKKWESFKDRIVENDPSKWGTGENMVWDHPTIEREWLEWKIKEAYERVNSNFMRIAKIVAKSQMKVRKSSSKETPRLLQEGIQ